MHLLYQTHSGYARKVLVMAHEIGIADQMEVVHHETSPTRRNETVFAANPLGKVPVLICDDGLVLFDSIVICEYLDGLHDGRRLIPLHGRERRRPTSKSPPGGRRSRCRTARRCATHCLTRRPGRG